MPVHNGLAGLHDKAARIISGEMTRAVRDSVMHTYRIVKERYSGPGGPKSYSGDRLRARTGRLRSRVMFELGGTAADRSIRGAVFMQQPYLPYARIHEFGGTISGRPWLTIPIPGGPADTRGEPRPARSFPNAFFIMSKRRNLLLVQRLHTGTRRKLLRNKMGRFRTGRKKFELQLLFVLKKSVRIPRRAVWAASRRQAAPWVQSRFDQAVKRSIEGIGAL